MLTCLCNTNGFVTLHFTESFQVFYSLLLFHHTFFKTHPVADHILNILALYFYCFLFLNLRQGYNLLALGSFQCAVFFYPFRFYRVGTLLVLLGDDDLT